jgi:hypothetical protein
MPQLLAAFELQARRAEGRVTANSDDPQVVRGLARRSGASWSVARGEGTRFSLLPPLPPPPHRTRDRWPIDADAPRKSCGRPRRTARTEPSTAFPPSLETRRNGRRLSTAPTGRRRSVASCSLGLFRSSTNQTNNLWSQKLGRDRLRSPAAVDFQRRPGRPLDANLSSIRPGRDVLQLRRAGSDWNSYRLHIK